ncbi:MAG: sigma-70 family RNA polymerase sigma factor [Gemmatimonadaceae bacterium]
MQQFQHVPTGQQLGAHTWSLQTLLDGVRARQDAHMSQLYRRFGDRLLARLYRSHPAIANEIVTDTFMSLPELLERYEERGQFEAWLHRVALNKLRSRARTERNEPTTTASKLDFHAGSRVTGRTMEQQEIVERLLSNLDERQRRIWCMLEDGYEVKEVARVLEMKENAVYQEKHRAKHKLRAAATAFLNE